MKSHQSGNAMAEYVVIVTALVGAAGLGKGLLLEDNDLCKGYDNCVTMALSKLQNRYKGFSNSITQVHEYPQEVPAASYSWDLSADTGDGESGEGGGGLEERPMQENMAVTQGGETIGILQGNSVVDSNGNVVGTYDDGVFTPSEGNEPVVAGVTRVVTDEAGNVAEPQVMTNCSTGELDAFVYESGVTGALHEPAKLTEVERDGRCGPYDTYKVVNNDGNQIGGRAYDGYYYATFSPPLIAEGEVVYIDTTTEITCSETECTEGDVARQIGPVCAVLPSGWETAGDPDASPLENYLLVEANGGVFGSVPPSEGTCPSLASKDLT